MRTREFTESELKMMAKLGLVPKDFEPAPMTDTERLDLQEECILELAELIGGMV